MLTGVKKLAKVRMEIGLRVKVLGAMHISSGSATEGLADKFLVKNAEGRMIIPGSSFKGRLRNYCQMLANSDKGFNQQLVDELFGTEGSGQGRLYFDDLFLVDENTGFESDRVGVSMDRKRKTVVDKALVFYPVADGVGGMVFAGKLEGTLPEENRDKFVALLYLGMKLFNKLGFAKTRGLGEVEIDPDIRCFKGSEESRYDADRIGRVVSAVAGN